MVLTGSEDRHDEARTAADAFLPGADLTVDLHRLPEGRLPALWDRVKDILEAVAGTCAPDLIIAPSSQDAHQDHRTIGEIMPTVFRDQLLWSYEIPKWDGDLGASVDLLSPDVGHGAAQGRPVAQVFPVAGKPRLVG